MAFFCGGCRYRVTAYPDWTAARVRRRCFASCRDCRFCRHCCCLPALPLCWAQLQACVYACA